MKSIDAFLYSAFDNTNVTAIIEFILWLAKSYNLSVKSVMDIGCGPGRMLKLFNELDWKVTGIEPYYNYFLQAKNSIPNYVDIKVENIGFNDIYHENCFDLIVAINGPFSYLLKLEQRIDAVKRVFIALKSGGIFFIDMCNFSYILRNYKEPQDNKTEYKGYEIVRHSAHKIDFHKNMFVHTDTYNFRQPGQEVAENIQIHSFSMFAFPEIEYILKQIGFKNIRTYNEGYSSRKLHSLTGSRIMVSGSKE